MTTQTDGQLTVKKYFTNIWDAVSSISKGMAITMGYVLKEKEVTLQYPEEKETLPKGTRMRLYNDVDDCIGCKACATACPVGCITIATEKRAVDAPEKKSSKGTAIKFDLTQYTIDKALCCFCGNCTTVCPTECLFHTTEFEYSTYNVQDLKIDYLSDEARSWKEKALKDRL